VGLAVEIPKTMAYLQVSNLKIEGADKFIIRDTARLQVVMMELQVTGEQSIHVSFDLFLRKGVVTWNDRKTAADLSPQQHIESDHPDLIAKSRSIASGRSTRDARKIYDFVSAWLKWPHGNRLGDSSSALIAYKQQVGVCSDFARLMTAMLRANGIPARSMTGLALPQYVNLKKSSEWNHQADSHAWVEFYTDGQWHFADPSWGGNSHFDHCDGFHLAYEEEQTERNIYNIFKPWLVTTLNNGAVADSNYAIIGAMSAPLKFMALASNDQVKIVPKGTVKIIYGFRIPLLVIVTLLIILFEILVRRKSF
jgi:hypothetical protein